MPSSVSLEYEYYGEHILIDYYLTKLQTKYKPLDDMV